MGKTKRFIKRCILYVGAFLAVVAITAGCKLGLFFITRSPDEGPNNGFNDDVTEQSAALSQVLENLMDSENIKVQANLGIKTNASEKPLMINANIMVSLVGDTENSNASILEKLKLTINGNLKFSEQTIDYSITYINGIIYVNLGGTEFKIETCNIQNDLNKVIEFATLKKFNINISLPDFSDFSFDPSMISMIAQDLQENDTETGKELKFNLLGMGNIVLLTDAEYFLTGAKLEDFVVEGTQISADLSSNLKADTVMVAEPQNKNEMPNLSGIVKFLEKADKFVYNGKSSGKINLIIKENKISADYIVDFDDFNNIKLFVSTKLFDKNLMINYQNDKLFFSFGEFKYYVNKTINFNEFIDAINFYIQKFGGKENTINIEALKNQIVENIDFNNISYLLSYIEDLIINENQICLEKENFDFKILCDENSITEINLNIKDMLSASISTNEEIDVKEIDESEYKFVLDEKLFDDLKTSIINNKTLQANAKIQYNNLNVDCVLKLDFSNEIKAQLRLQCFNQNIVLTIISDKAYLVVGNMLKLKGNVKEIIDFVKTQTKILDSLQNTNISKINEVLSKIFMQKILCFTKENDNLSGLQISYNDIVAKIEIKEFEQIEFEEAENYQNIIDALNFAKTLTSSLKENVLAFDINANYKNYVLSGKVQFDDNQIVASLKTTIFGKEILIDYQNQTIFVNIGGLKFYIEQNKIKDFISGFENEIDFESLKNVDINQILSEVFVLFDNNLLKFQYRNLQIKLNPQNLQVNVLMDDLDAELTLTSKFEKTEKKDYINLYELKPTIKAVLNTIKTKNISGNVVVTLNLFNEDNNFNINYQISFDNSNIFAKINTQFKGLNVNIYVNNKDIYLDIASLKVKFNIDELPQIIYFVNQTFDANISLNTNELLDKNKIVDKIKDIDFDFINSVVAKQNNLTCNVFDNLEISVDFDDYVKRVDFEHNNKKAYILCTNFNTIDFSDIDFGEYKNYTIFAELLKSANNLIKSKKYNIDANISKFAGEKQTKNINAKLNLDITGALNAYVDVLGLDKEITVLYENKMLYFSYGGEKGIKIKIREDAVQEILSILTTAFNINTKSIPYLDEFLSKPDIDTSNLETILPKIEISNPLNYLEYIKNFVVTDNYFAIVLKADKLGKYAGGKDIAITINYQNSKIESIVVNDLYLNSEANECYNIVARINDFENVKTINDKDKHIDLSDSKDLIRAFINTSNLNDYQIKGKIKLNIDIGINFDAAEVDIDAKIKKQTVEETVLDETLGEYVKKQKTEIYGMIKLSNYPLIAGVNNSNTNGGISRKRTITLYFKDGYIYLSTIDDKKSFYDRFERATKITPEYLVSNLKYYMQYLLGFTNTIQSKIDEAIDKSQSYVGETDLSNIIQHYSKNGNKHTIKINLAEVAHNSDIGTLTVVLTTINNDATNNKDYLYRLDVDLKLLDGMISLTTDQNSNDLALFLVEIGKEANMSDADKYFNNYDNVYKLGLDGEYEKEAEKSFKQANTGTSEIRLVDGGKLYKTLSGNIASKVTLPSLATVVEDDGITHTEYVFGGWFYDEDCLQEFTSNVYPRYNTTLFAKWIKQNPKIYATINFVSNQDNLTVNSITGFVGESFELPVLSNIKQIVDENTTILKIFRGWKTVDGNDYSKTVFEHSTLTLFAVWEEKVTKTYKVTIYSAGEIVYSTEVEAGIEFEFPNMPCFTLSTKYYTTSNFAEDSLVTNFVINENKTFFARNKFNVKVVSKYTTINGSSEVSINDLFYEGETINLAWYQSFVKNMGTYYQRYEFLGYVLNETTSINNSSIVVSAKNMNFVASWKDDYKYCIVTFNATAWTNPSEWTVKRWIKSPTNFQAVTNTNGTNKVEIELGKEIEFSNYVASCECKYAVNYKFQTVAWGTSTQNVNVGSYNGNTKMQIYQNTTLYPIWKCQL